MALLSLIYAPDPIFKKKAAKVVTFDGELRQTVDDMIETMQVEQAVGMGGNMVGILQRIIVIDPKNNGESTPQSFVNPEVVMSSDEMQTFEEASICFPFISAEITRPQMITLHYQDIEGNSHEKDFEGFVATVIQHEVDYLDGVVFLGYLSQMKRQMLMKKMQKQMKLNPPHVHGANCKHSH